MTLRRIFPIALAIAFITPGLASAHATGVSYQTDSGGYTVDVGYSNPAPQEGESVLFDYRLLKGGEAVPFSDAWIKIESTPTDAVVFAGGIRNNPLGGARMSYVFPHAGTYTVDVRYEDDANSIVESSFPITILPGGGSVWYRSTQTYLIGLGLIALIEAGALVLLMRRKRI